LVKKLVDVRKEEDVEAMKGIKFASSAFGQTTVDSAFFYIFF